MTEPNSAPVAVVIFGVSGDLTRRKLIPALYELTLAGILPSPFFVVGFARRDWDDELIKSVLREGITEFSRTKKLDDSVLEKLLSPAHYICASFNDSEGYRDLDSWLTSNQIKNCLYYLATPPESYVEVIRHLGEAGLQKVSEGWRRIII
jgi:glucose-6-phosphate 1-dehydrogenase